MSRDLQYRDDAAKLDEVNQEWLAQLPVGDMIRFGWLSPAPHPSAELRECLRFFGVNSVREWNLTYSGIQQKIAFRTSPSYDSRPSSVAAWLRQGEIQGRIHACAPWNVAGFRESLPHIRALTRTTDPGAFLPRLQELCAKNGVAVSVVRAPSGCRASGATRFLPSGHALLLLSVRYLTDDHFWFTFFHEAGHLVLHERDEIFLEGTDAPVNSKETEANAFAAEMLVPPESQAALLALPLNSRAVVRFARGLGVSPGIVVGQLQHHGRLPHSHLNGLKRRYRWPD